MSDFAQTSCTSMLAIDMREQGLKRVRLFWPEGRAQHTYTIAIGHSLSLEFDSSFPVRPQTINFYGALTTSTYDRLSELFGETLVHTLSVLSPNQELFGLLELSPKNRLAIARLQEASPSSSPAMKRSCVAMIVELAQRILLSRVQPLKTV